VTEKTKVGLIGAGKNGRVHAENIALCTPPAELAAVSDVLMKAAAKYAADFQIPTVYQHHRPILANNLIEAVLICSNTDAHPQFTKESPNLFPPFYCWEQERTPAPNNFK
jgi:myo-inositol 2-dehydrogenase/D-chiro-inositol 1-dehydrogenase